MFRRYVAVALLLCLSLLAAPPLSAQQPTPSPQPAPAAAVAPQATPTPQASPTVNPNDPIARIRDEGMNRSQVMETLSYLTNAIGPRLTNSPNMRRANEWTRERLTAWGLQNARLEAWGPFGRGWSLRRFSAQVVEPQAFPVIAYPKAWSPGTEGPVTGEVVYLDAPDVAGLERYRGRLRGAIVLLSPLREVPASFEAPGRRLTETELLNLANAPDPATLPARPQFQLTPEMRAAAELATRRLQFAQDEGAAMIVDTSPRGIGGGTVFVQSAIVPQAPNTPAAQRLSAWSPNAPRIAPQMTMATEHYNRLVRMLQHGERLRMTVDLAVEFHEQDLMGHNTVAEIPGTDLREEIVMLGGHMDSWHGGTGATDNAAGVAVAMEAVRILRALNLQPRRTIRIALWSGEEQGLYGSRAYVAQHFGTLEPAQTAAAAGAAATGAAGGNSATPATPAAAPAMRLVPKPDYEKLSVYFNLDNGTGRIRGIYAQGNEAAASIFRRWLMPFRDLGASTITMSNTGSTDHIPFDAIGLPGFQFIQDPVEYGTRTHHSNMDLYDRLQAEDMRQASIIMAAFIYNAAMMDERLPRKPAPATR